MNKKLQKAIGKKGVGMPWIGNYYGGLIISEYEGAYYWGVEDHSDMIDYYEIPKYLYDALIQFRNEEKAKDGKD